MAFLTICLFLLVGRALSEQDTVEEDAYDYRPGDIMEGTGQREINRALDQLLVYGDILESRRCAIGLANVEGDVLINPKYYLQKGVLHSFMAQVISPNNTGLTLVTKMNTAIVGTEGVFTYDIIGTDYKIAIAWSVPENYLLYDNMFNMKIYHQSVAVNSKLWDQMYTLAGPWKAEGYEKRNEYGITLNGVMTDHNRAKLIVMADTSKHDPLEGPELYTDCNYHAGWFGSYCWQECSPLGFCWADKKCGNKDDCKGPLTCYTDCKTRGETKAFPERPTKV